MNAINNAGYRNAINSYGYRPNKTKKGSGYFGELRLPGVDVATEYSIGVDIDGKETLIPSLVPTLTQDELNLMINDIIPNRKQIPEHIINKAIDHAIMRMRNGLDPFK